MTGGELNHPSIVLRKSFHKDPGGARVVAVELADSLNFTNFVLPLQWRHSNYSSH